MKTIYHYRHNAENLDENGERYHDWEIALVQLQTDTPDLWWAGRYQIWLKTTDTCYIIDSNDYTREEAIRKTVKYTNLCIEGGTPDILLKKQFTRKS